MSLTAKQRAALAASAFVYPKARRHPVPTKAQAKRAGISEQRRLAPHRSALSHVQSQTSGSCANDGPLVRRRSGSKVKSVQAGAPGGATRPASTAKRRR